MKPGLRPEEPAGQDRWPPTGQRVHPSHRAHHLFLSSQQQMALRKKKKKKSFLVKLSWQYVLEGRPHDLTRGAGWLSGLCTGGWWAGDSHVWAALAAALQNTKSRRQPSIPRALGSSSASCSTASNIVSSHAQLLLRSKGATHSHGYTLGPALTSHLHIQVPGGRHVWELGRQFIHLLPHLGEKN